MKYELRTNGTGAKLVRVNDQGQAKKRPDLFDAVVRAEVSIDPDELVRRMQATSLPSLTIDTWVGGEEELKHWAALIEQPMCRGDWRDFNVFVKAALRGEIRHSREHLTKVLARAVELLVVLGMDPEPAGRTELDAYWQRYAEHFVSVLRDAGDHFSDADHLELAAQSWGEWLSLTGSGELPAGSWVIDFAKDALSDEADG